DCHWRPLPQPRTPSSYTIPTRPHQRAALFPYTTLFRSKEPFEAGRLANQENPGRSAGNGSVMRCAPVALLYHNDADRLIRVSTRSEEHTSELQSLRHLVCRLLLEKKKEP